MKKAGDQRYGWAILGSCVLVALVAIFVWRFMQRNQQRIVEQNQQYLEDAAERSVGNMNDLFRNSMNSVAMVCHIYEQQLTGPTFDFHQLAALEELSSFDRFHFVDMEGRSYDKDGRSQDVSSQIYYREGVQGHSGICYIEDAQRSNKKTLFFYAPLCYDGQVIGVLSGVLGESFIRDRMQNRFFDVEANEFLCLRDGTVVAAFGKKETEGDILSDAKENFGVSAEVLAALSQALELHQSYGFRFNADNGVGNAYLTPLAFEDFMLFQTFPAAASGRMTARADQDALILEIQMAVLFSIFLLLCIITYLRRTRRLAREKEDYGAIIDSVKLLFRRFVVFDLEKDRYEYLREGQISAMGIPPAGSFTTWYQAFQGQYGEDEGSKKVQQLLTRESLERELSLKDRVVQVEYQTFQGGWEKISLIKLNLDEDRTTRVLATVEDVTKLKYEDQLQREALEAAYHAADAANHAKSEFLSRMSHDIRTPMNGIVGLTAIMGLHLDDREKVQDCLSKIVSSSKHLLSLINEVLDMSKIESGKMVLAESGFVLASLVDELLGIVQPSANQKHQELSVTIKDIVHEDVIGDDLRLQQVFVNLLSNAIKYTGEGGHIHMTLSEQPSKQPRLGHYTFVVEDDGIGMDPRFLEQIFTPFERAEDVRVSKVQGTGLGMSIARNIIQMMGGSIEVESQLGKGSRFTVRFLLKLQEVAQIDEVLLQGLPVLVADDDRVSCEYTCETLHELGMQGEWVLSGREAVDAVCKHHGRDDDYYAVILDWQMPEMDGVETAREIRKKVGPDMPIIILSAYDWGDIEAEAREAGVNAFVGKPLFKSKLRSLFITMHGGAREEPADPLDSLRGGQLQGRRALLVEDNALNQEIAKEILEMAGLAVDTAGDGQQGLEAFRASPEGYYQVVFMDVQMPVMNGYESTMAIRALDRPDAPKVPIVAMTANTFSEDVQAAKDAGMDYFIAKPIDLEQLTELLHSILA